MFNLLKNIVQIFTKPVFTILFLVFTLSVFIFQARNYQFIIDDYFFLAITTKLSYWESFDFYIKSNGRWFSNILTVFVFGTLGCKAYLYWYFQILQFFLFIISVSFLFNSMVRHLGVKKLSKLQSLHIGTFFTCLFFWFYFDARIEVWYWESACLVHLVSLICIFFLYGIIFKPDLSGILRFILILLLSLFIGGLSETFALACILISGYQFIRKGETNKLLRISHLLLVIFVGLSLVVSVLCPGASLRMDHVPEALISEGLKNTVYTFYLHLAKIKHIPFKIAGIFLLWPLSSIIMKHSGSNFLKSFNFTKLDYLIILILILENTFIPAYFISQETPDRVFAFNWLLVLLLLLNYLIRRNRYLPFHNITSKGYDQVDLGKKI